MQNNNQTNPIMKSYLCRQEVSSIARRVLDSTSVNTYQISQPDKMPSLLSRVGHFSAEVPLQEENQENV